jgi:hypothetical protein
MLTDLNNFIKNLLTVKSSALKSDLVRVYASNPKSSTGIHLFVSKCNVTSADAILSAFPKVTLAAR